MSKAKKQSTAVLVMGIMYTDENKYKQAIKKLEKKFGSIKLKTEGYNFSYSDYYKKEMGEHLKKELLVFNKMIKRENIVSVKKITDKIEKKLSDKSKIENNRTVNIDPGILTLENFLLATNKNFSHRVYIKSGVFLDLTLIYKKHEGFTTLPWTYADFKSDNNILFLNKVRNLFFDKLKESSPF